ncbi:uncharacterized protein LOC108893845 [Lates calcarifer]|uniref:Uncharacterized protein LOC108893845 n=1 Tax=Lates calcarifer TaxID=8187 RepID=A0AAJ7Q693_LATCA|nr:uncharacterized protein LOC108893845 [Lates calcarifer]
MIHRDIALEALSVICNANVTSVQKQRLQPFPHAAAAPQEQLLIKYFISTVLDADETSQVSRSSFHCIQQTLQSGKPVANFPGEDVVDTPNGRNHIIDEDEFFAPEYDYDFSRLRDTETYWRGGEKYERPCGWQRFALKVLNKYDGNTWLGTRYRSTQSCPGEWPVSYHGTSMKGAEAIIGGHYKPGPRKQFGRGIYSTPHISEAIPYAKSFISQKDGKRYKVILQNRINPAYRWKCNNDKYWLIPISQGISAAEERDIVEKAIRPYGLLLKQI